ncbi:MAG TPA: hypothetical protein VND96_18855 [Candidatus Micrarchaeaceae archaeon]|nr:hypothetical protein [Candidatus Micrarchaeaceae archaeon]
MDRTEELEKRVRNLSQTIEEMRYRMARLEGRDPDATVAKQSNRRGFLRLGAGAVLGALGWAAVRAVPASATTGNPVILGNANSADAATTLITTGADPQVLGVSAASTTWVEGTTGAFAGPLQGLGTSGPYVEGVDGWAGGSTGAGVYGLTDTGYGVIGESNQGIALYARSSGRIRQDGLLASGLPGYSPNLYEQVRDADGILWIHNATGDWRRVNTVRVDASDGSGVPFTPFRLKDTRTGAKPAVGSTTVITVTGVGGASSIPADAVAVMGNLTATQYTDPGFLALSPAGVTVGTSSVNFITGQGAIANGFIVGLGTGVTNGGKIQVTVAGSASHFLVDITAYVQ